MPLEDAARLLASGTPQRKAFVYLSEGVGKDLDGMYVSPVTPCEAKSPTNPCLHSVSLKTMMEAMQRSNVTTYAIDLRGEFGVYGVDSGRICVAALNDHNLAYVAKAIAAVSA